MPRFRHLFTVALAALLMVAPAARSASSDMVVGQVFAGGGNTNAPYRNDFVELFNRGTTAVNLDTWSIQYASASGTTVAKVNRIRCVRSFTGDRSMPGYRTRCQDRTNPT